MKEKHDLVFMNRVFFLQTVGSKEVEMLDHQISVVQRLDNQGTAEQFSKWGAD